MSSRFGYPNMQGINNEQAVRSYLFQLSDKLEYEISRLQEMIKSGGQQSEEETNKENTEQFGALKGRIEEIEASVTDLDERVTALEEPEQPEEEGNNGQGL